jgi:hypothetical protein
VTFLLQCHQDEGSHAHTSPDRSHAPNILLFVALWAGTFVLTVISHLLCHTSWCTAHVMVMPAVYIFMARYPTCLVMIAVPFLMFWLI